MPIAAGGTTSPLEQWSLFSREKFLRIGRSGHAPDWNIFPSACRGKSVELRDCTLDGNVDVTYDVEELS